MGRRHKKVEQGFVETMRRIRRAGISSPPPGAQSGEDDCRPLDERVRMMLGLADVHVKEPWKMICFIMYDIASNKVRTQVAKYLLRQGCSRIQKSIFMACLEPAAYAKIKEDLAEVQACYDNMDSIIIAPISMEMLNSMKVIGQNVDIDVITLVINYDVPLDNEYYVHRIGRTGRAGKTGMSFTFANARELRRIRDIERFCKTTIEERKLPDASKVLKSKARKVLNTAWELREN